MKQRHCEGVALAIGLTLLGCAAHRETQTIREARTAPIQRTTADSLTALTLQEGEYTEGSITTPTEKGDVTHEYMRWHAQALDVAVADLEGDGREELFLLTPDSVLVFGSAVKIAGFPLSPERNDWVSRDKVGAIVVDRGNGMQGTTVYVNTSDLKQGDVHQWNGERFEDLEQPLLAFPLGLRHAEAGTELMLKKWVAGRNYFVEQIGVFDDVLGEQRETLYFYAAASGDIDPNYEGPENILLGLDGRISVYDDFFNPVHGDEREFGGFARLFGRRLLVTSDRPPGEGDYYVILEWDGTQWKELYQSIDCAGTLVSADVGDLDNDGESDLIWAEQRGTRERPLTIIHLDIWP